MADVGSAPLGQLFKDTWYHCYNEKWQNLGAFNFRYFMILPILKALLQEPSSAVRNMVHLFFFSPFSDTF